MKHLWWKIKHNSHVLYQNWLQWRGKRVRGRANVGQSEVEHTES